MNDEEFIKMIREESLKKKNMNLNKNILCAGTCKRKIKAILDDWKGRKFCKKCYKEYLEDLNFKSFMKNNF